MYTGTPQVQQTLETFMKITFKIHLQAAENYVK